jgi:AraC family transcriptional regulator
VQLVCGLGNLATLVASSLELVRGQQARASVMQAQRQEDLKYPTSTSLKSSNDLGWSTLFAELRSYSQREDPGPVAPHAKISITVRGSDEGLVTRKVGGSRWSARPTTGSIWLKPIGGKYDEAQIRSPKVQVIHPMRT